jgi:hypothetical protein
MTIGVTEVSIIELYWMWEKSGSGFVGAHGIPPGMNYATDSDDNPFPI